MKFSVLILLIINLLFIFGCGNTTSTQTGYLKQPTANIDPNASAESSINGILYFLESSSKANMFGILPKRSTAIIALVLLVIFDLLYL